METSYESVTNRVNSVALPQVVEQTGGCGPQTNPARPALVPPLSITRHYEPYGESRTSYDPSKGRKFSKLRRDGSILFSELGRSLIQQTDQIHSRERTQHSYRRILYDCLSSPPVCVIRPVEKQIATWTVNDDFRSLSARLGVSGKARSDFNSEVADAISSTQQAAFDQALNAYDLLTEIGELRETVGYLSSKLTGGAELVRKFADKDPKTWEQARRSTPKTLMRSGNAALRKLGGRWMEYRYALMPLLYSFDDINKLLKEKSFRYQSERSRKRISLDFDPGPPPGAEGLIVKSSGEIMVRSLTKARYDAGDLQRLVSTLGMNPFRTAWELIPLSFVVDWFLNIGEAITSLTGIDYASQRLGVTSVRESSTFTYTHYDRYRYRYEMWGLPNGWLNSCGTVIPDETIIIDTFSDKDVRYIKTESYNRTLWSRPTPKVIFDPFLNWKRFVDAFVLGFQPTKKILRSLR